MIPWRGRTFFIEKEFGEELEKHGKRMKEWNTHLLDALLYCCWHEENIGRRTNFDMGSCVGSPGGGVHF